MSIVVNGSGTITGISTGGLNDGIIADADIASMAASKLTGALPAISGASLTNIPAANITGTLPAISGANLTGVGVDGIVSTANATAITIDSSESVGIDNSTGFGTYSGTGVKYAKSDGTFFVGRDGGIPLFINRETSQGDMIAFNASGTSLVKLGTDGGDFTVGTGTGGNTERMRIGSDGGVIIGPAISSLYFGDGDTGFYESGDDTFNVKVGGSMNWTFDGNSMRAPTTGGAHIRNTAGSQSVPAFTFNDDTNTGIYRIQADQMGFTAGGSQRMRIYDDNNKGAVALTPEFASGPIFNSGQLSFADDVERTYPGVNTGALIAVGYYADNNGARYHHGLFWASYGIGTSTVNVLGDPANRFRGTDTDGNMCCMSAAGNSNFRIKNRLGVTTNVSINIIQMQGN